MIRQAFVCAHPGKYARSIRSWPLLGFSTEVVVGGGWACGTAERTTSSSWPSARLDRAAQARRTLRRDGLYRANRFGDLIPHPAVKVEKDSAAAYSRMLARLDLPELERRAAPPATAPLRRMV